MNMSPVKSSAYSQPTSLVKQHDTFCWQETYSYSFFPLLLGMFVFIV